ncbi:hypothetical protein [Qipengyuania aquimaris]|uniref:hypothetical protein n=1 Tax=Qipengyuania aquimaris TaxID=255984 RepID=UPI001CD22601|nr:hypothetical protein [Qipengyuania aquimaris]MCA0903896.1 hypothetical protein [Qipengyuania aquimaris]
MRAQFAALRDAAPVRAFALAEMGAQGMDQFGEGAVRNRLEERRLRRREQGELGRGRFQGCKSVL